MSGLLDAAFGSKAPVYDIVKDFDLSKLNLATDGSNETIHTAIAPSFDGLSAETVSLLPTSSKVAVAGALRVISRIPEANRNYDAVVDILTQTAIVEPIASSVVSERIEKVLKIANGEAVSNVGDDGADEVAIKEIEPWLAKLTGDEVGKSLNIDYVAIANLATKTTDADVSSDIEAADAANGFTTSEHDADKKDFIRYARVLFDDFEPTRLDKAISDAADEASRLFSFEPTPLDLANIKDKAVKHAGEFFDVVELSSLDKAKQEAVEEVEGLFATADPNHERTLVDLTVVKFPNPKSSTLQVYRIKVYAWVRTKCGGILPVTEAGITAEYLSRGFKPRDETIEVLPESTVARAIDMTDRLFD